MGENLQMTNSAPNIALSLTPDDTSHSNIVCIIGTGDYARALAKRLARAGNTVLCGSRSPQARDLAARDPAIGHLDISVVSVDQALEKSELIFLAMHSKHMEKTLTPYKDKLEGKVLVDVSNPMNSTNSTQLSHAEKLSQTFPKSTIVKALNTISAYALENGQDQGDNKAHIASDCHKACDRVERLVQGMGLEAVTYNTLSSARHLERRQQKLFRGWGKALIIATPVFIIWTVFSIIRYHVDYKFPWRELPLHTFNKILGQNAITLLTLCYTPGVIASLLQLLRCTKHSAFPLWLHLWMQARKQLGVLALSYALIHACTSVAHNSPAYFSVFYLSNSVEVPVNTTDDLTLPMTSKMNWIGEVTFSSGAMAVTLMSVLGVTSLPSVGSRLNWKQWTFIQSYIGLLCLVVATLHVIVQGLPYMLGQPLAQILKGVTGVSLILPVLTIGLRLVLLSPCLSVPLYYIRQGREFCKRRAEKEECSDTVQNGMVNKNFDIEAVTKH